ncbi:LLM class flavin-dependent oxidoreductase [Kribbella sandramycini]|uniref:Alkanesulfonate monooxygenase SsuD/methylene tetrahydromethanopterin reductase-like flavin-dependent oxidoreductase (Luciferase family) n=1 Tax=Kribbella sandramycini TaxID=60450 RepID=A0A7Y4P369_9ACTN|nr:LLM class flavin-dependent oxidoreductase [Kribbella sandramycini]MBB6566775.1 alkanesulfonate monooxygenase SsuD/methylene tetrahydromethanopterin reductase-like flavin-dependent oxidoreductase (luciferase family) [Kribbella sandramycini]NOL45561.1 LLM class flavin-dependent oxidoreductase [Kribbella sandramycini]
MRLGLYLNLYGAPGERPQLADAVEQAQLAEQAGFEWIVLGERHLHRPGYHEILTSLTWLAAHTSRIGIATSGIVAPLYQPVVLAETLAHLDILSGGRLTAGFVLGYRPEEFALYGVRQRERVARFEECIDIVTRLWTEETVTYEGRFTSLHDAYLSPRPLQKPRPKLWNGGRVSAVLERTARTCDGWTTSFNELDADLPEKIAEYQSYPRGAGTLGNEVILCREGFCAPASQDARKSLEEPLRDLYDAYTGWKRTSTDAARYTQGWDDITDRSVIGSPAECADRIAHYDAMGADGIILRIQPPGMPQSEALKAIEAFGNL